MINPFKKSKQKNEGVPKTALMEATKPISLDPAAFKHNASVTVKDYIRCVYSQDITLLPNSKVTEEFFYNTLNAINYDKQNILRTFETVTINNISFNDYTNNRYSVTSMSYVMDYTVTGLYGTDPNNMYPYTDNRKGAFTFINDARLGFVLSEHRSLAQ